MKVVGYHTAGGVSQELGGHILCHSHSFVPHLPSMQTTITAFPRTSASRTVSSSHQLGGRLRNESSLRGALGLEALKFISKLF